MLLLMKSSLSLSVSPLSLSPPSVCLSSSWLQSWVTWVSDQVGVLRASSVGEAQELCRVAAGAEICLSRPGLLWGWKGNINTPQLPPLLCPSTNLPFFLWPLSWLVSDTGFTVSADSPLHSHTSMGGWTDGQWDRWVEATNWACSFLRN